MIKEIAICEIEKVEQNKLYWSDGIRFSSMKKPGLGIYLDSQYHTLYTPGFENASKKVTAYHLVIVEDEPDGKELKRRILEYVDKLDNDDLYEVYMAMCEWWPKINKTILEETLKNVG